MAAAAAALPLSCATPPRTLCTCSAGAWRRGDVGGSAPRGAAAVAAAAYAADGRCGSALAPCGECGRPRLPGGVACGEGALLCKCRNMSADILESHGDSGALGVRPPAGE